jgi:uncharacterized phage infection (PIP) family protein YhgE
MPLIHIDNLHLHVDVKTLHNITNQGDEIMSAISDFKTAVDEAFGQVNAGLDNIQADETTLAQQIADLKTQIGSGSSTLTPEDQAALDAIVTNANAMAARTKSIADSVPDSIPAPPPTEP